MTKQERREFFNSLSETKKHCIKIGSVGFGKVEFIKRIPKNVAKYRYIKEGKSFSNDSIPTNGFYHWRPHSEATKTLLVASTNNKKSLKKFKDLNWKSLNRF